MLRRNVLRVMMTFMMFLLAACGQVGENKDDSRSLYNSGFQDNGSKKAYPYFRLTEVFKGWGGLEEMWDSISAKGFNVRFTKTSDDFPDDFITFSRIGANVIGDKSRVVILLAGTDASNLLANLVDQEENFPMRSSKSPTVHFYKDGVDYMSGFYALLDDIFKSGEDPGSKEMVSVNWKIMSRLRDKKTPQDLHDDMQDIMDTILDKRFPKDFTDVTSAAGKLLARSDYTRTSGGQDLGIGNSVQGIVDLVKWYNRMEKDSTARSLMRSQAMELASIFDPSPTSTNNLKVKALLTNLTDYFTMDGGVYSDPTPGNIYHTNASDIYSDTEIGNTIRELFPAQVQLLMRSDRPNAIISSVDGQNVYLLHQLTRNLKALGYDPESADIESSLTNLMKYDAYGRDRTDPQSGAYPVSHLESLLFLTHLTTNIGWSDRNTVSTDEVTDSTDPRYDHGHGAYTGRLSLNDSLFSIKTHKSMKSLGIFDIGLKETDGNDISRSQTAFTISNRQNYKFFFNQNYDVLQCLAPTCVGDLGTPNGGNPTGQPLGMNAFTSFSPDGLGETQLTAWTLGLIVRACFNGEGPYYFADPGADSFMIGNKTWYTYKRPNGKIYAYVNKDDSNNWTYFYPVDNHDPEDQDTALATLEGKKQRYNRYKAEWKTDYYMTHYMEEIPGSDGYITTVDRYMSIDTSNGDANTKPGDTKGINLTDTNPSAGRLTYKEIIKENDQKRACSSPEEALFRNFQWFMTEKKMAIILPMKVNLDGTQAAIFQVLEGNGLAGLSAIRKYRGNHFWAKKADSGTSEIPGDYRIEVVSSADGQNSSPINSTNVYFKTLDCGHATPAIVGFNIPALTRLGFPRYTTLKDRGNGIFDSDLGSKEFDVNDTNWKSRCAVLPPFIALVSALRQFTPDITAYDNPLKKGLRTFAEGTSPLIKPMIYYQKSAGQHPYETWKPRITGSATPGPSPDWTEYTGNDFLRSSSDFHNDPSTYHKASTWSGTDLEKQYYQPMPVKTLLNILIDSDLAQVGKRMDGLLPVMMKNKGTTKLLGALMSDVNDTDLIYGALEQISGMLKVTKGGFIQINETNAKHIVYPDWMFATGTATGDFGEYTAFTGVNDEDIVLDTGIDRLIGHKDNGDLDGYGLVQYVDEQKGKSWSGLDKRLDFLEDILHPSSAYSILVSMLDMNDAVFGRSSLYTDQEITGLVYSLGKLVTHYSNAKAVWINQGEDGFDDLYKIIHVRLPEINELMKDGNGFTGNNYMSALKINADMMKPDGAVEFLVTTMKTKADWKKLMADSSAFLKSPMITGDDPLWSTLSELLGDLAKAMEDARDGSLMDNVYATYGFQKN